MLETSALIIPAFLAGILTFLAPCTLPLVPGYLTYISGSSLDDLSDPEKFRSVRKRIFFNGVLYTLGFSIVFIIFGTLAGAAGTALAPYRIWLTRIGGVLVIIFGLSLMGVFKIPFLMKEWHVKADKNVKRSRPLASFILGASFATGWTPCVGPILGSILLLASTSTDVMGSAFLLGVFSLGLAIPFLLVAWGIGSAMKFLTRVQKYLKTATIIGGALLVGLGVLLLTNKMVLLISWGYRVFGFVNYERILDYL